VASWCCGRRFRRRFIVVVCAALSAFPPPTQCLSAVASGSRLERRLRCEHRRARSLTLQCRIFRWPDFGLGRSSKLKQLHSVGCACAALRHYRDPDTLAHRLPTLRLLTRPVADLQIMAEWLLAPVRRGLDITCDVTIAACSSQIVSGALPLETIASCGLSIEPKDQKKSGRLLNALARALRALPISVIGRIANDVMIFD
jgi:L-seryl-tRNA selenium transferase